MPIARRAEENLTQSVCIWRAASNNSITVTACGSAFCFFHFSPGSAKRVHRSPRCAPARTISRLVCVGDENEDGWMDGWTGEEQFRGFCSPSKVCARFCFRDRLFAFIPQPSAVVSFVSHYRKSRNPLYPWSSARPRTTTTPWAMELSQSTLIIVPANCD